MTDRQLFAETLNVSRETMVLFDIWHEALLDWSRRFNLVSPSTLTGFWTRHALDSAQLIGHVPDDARRLIDLGSGGGFPGLALAILMRDRPGAQVVLVESHAKKASFMRDVAVRCQLPVRVLAQRIESCSPAGFDVITARALAPLPKLVAWSSRFRTPETISLFPKGRGFEDELEQANLSARFDVSLHPSRTDPEARIVVLKERAHDERAAN